MTAVLVVENDADAPAGLLGEALDAAGLEVDLRRPYAGDALPGDLCGHRALVVLGGDMEAGDVEGYPFLAAEQALVRDGAARGTPVLGLCLGAQIAALALGGTVGRRRGGPCIGVELVGEDPDPALAALAPDAGLVHWHRDAFTLPPGATPVLGDDHGFRQGSVLALQPHPEATVAVVEGWCAWEGADAELAAAGTDPAAFVAATPTAEHAGRAVLDAWVATLD